VRGDQVDDALFDVGPDRTLRCGAGGRPFERGGGAELGHVVDGHDDAQVELLVGARVDDGDGRRPGQEAGDLFGRAHGRAEADALGRLVEQSVETLEREGQVGAALGRGDGVDLVDDDGLHALEGLARLRGEHEVERLGRRDEDVGRGAGEPAAVARARVAGAHAHRDVGSLGAQASSGLGDAHERRTEVAFDVDAECLERGDVEHAGAVQLLVGRGRRGQRVDRPEERGERLARAGRRDDEGVVALADGRPGALLRAGRRGEGPPEPLAGRGGEALEHVGHRCHPALHHRHSAEGSAQHGGFAAAS
jgi:hypothetical protein